MNRVQGCKDVHAEDGQTNQWFSSLFVIGMQTPISRDIQIRKSDKERQPIQIRIGRLDERRGAGAHVVAGQHPLQGGHKRHLWFFQR
jgi:hypothetical protein